VSVVVAQRGRKTHQGRKWGFTTLAFAMPDGGHKSIDVMRSNVRFASFRSKNLSDGAVAVSGLGWCPPFECPMGTDLSPHIHVIVHE
jgi:hypothetical protein